MLVLAFDRISPALGVALAALALGPRLALAGTLVVESLVPARIVADGQPLAQLYIPATVDFPAFPAGNHRISVYRGTVPEHLEIQVPEEGTVRVVVGTATLQAMGGPPKPAIPPQSMGPGRLEVRPDGDTSCTLRIDDAPAVLCKQGSPTCIQDLTPGERRLEIRSPDGQIIWVRGRVRLGAGETLVLGFSEGRAPEPFVTPGAWLPEP